MRTGAWSIAVGFAAPTELPRDVARQQIDGEQVIDPAQPAGGSRSLKSA